MLIVRVLLELELPAVLHELLELDRVALAQFLKTRLNLLLFDVIVLIVFVSSW